jgi:hypothetical protein
VENAGIVPTPATPGNLGSASSNPSTPSGSYLQGALQPPSYYYWDCHNATFRPPWISSPGTLDLLNSSDLLLVHNDWVKKQAIEIGISNERLYVLEDPIALVEDRTEQNQNVFPHPWILCPCSFNKDEPIEAVLDAARLAPEITFVLTGNTARAKGIHNLSDIPPNIKLAGFLPTAEFDSFLCNTDVVWV